MIFKQLFQPKWQHKDAQVRLQAIQKLADSSILEQVAAKDIDTDVRKHALEKLNTLASWDKAMRHDSDVKLQKLALEKVKLMLFNQGVDLSQNDKEQYLAKCNHMPLLEDYARRGDDHNLRVQVIKRLDKASLNYDLAIRDNNEEVALICAQSIADSKQLEKIAQKAKHSKVKSWASEKLAELKAAAEKPAKIRKDASLLLSKLLALKDKTDYLQVKSTGEALLQQWQLVSTELTCLPEEEQLTLTNKFAQISDKFQSSLAQLEVEYNKAQQAEAALAQQQQIQQQVQQAIQTIQDKVANAIANEGDAELDDIVKLISDAKSLLSQDHIGGRVTEQLFNQLNGIEQNAAHLPEFAEQVALATRAVTQLNQWTLPQEIGDFDQAQEQFDSWFDDWKKLRKSMLFDLPVELNESSQTLINEWKNGLKSFSSQQNSAIKQLKGQMRELDRLIKSGRYNVALGLFRKISEGIDGLTSKSYSKIEREHQRLNEEINELEGWKSYIGLPRKRELVAEMDALVAQPMQDVHERAKQIKLARHTWRLLGNTDSEENSQLNEAFDIVVEKAFAPCREKFAELEAQRAANLAARNQLVDDAKAAKQAFENNGDYAELAKALTRLQNAWNKAGSVERSEYAKVSQAFFDIIRPLRARINTFHNDNAQQKKSLIEQAQECAQSEDLNQASEKLKALQQQWKNIGFAGANTENKLWGQFRAINDTVFNKKQADYQAEKDKQQVAFESIKSELDTIAGELDGATLELCYSKLEQVKAVSVEQCSPGQAKRLHKQINQLIDSCQKRIADLKQNVEQQNLQNWLVSLEGYVNSGTVDEAALNQLPSLLVNAIELAQNSPATGDASEQRRDLAIRMEIIAGIEPPVQDANRKMEIQVQLLSEKLNDGETPSGIQLLHDWLSLGPVQAQDKALFERVTKALLAM
ncbi:hypothetical protein DS2_00630 [Catenovulum agarivorans DS-2]|uniref:DUF349 domain-containing protein n=2 Tax=Catenovulum agarivorans TaxID=1172192 RepID=W7QWR1_9ALTE|nr:hypothetical protein DS2_00630 [Catenovulum agarivorans DS-2]